MVGRNKLPKFVVVIISVIVAAIVIASAFLVLFYAGVIPLAGTVVTRNSDAFTVGNGYSVSFNASNTNLNVVNSPNGTVYLTIRVVDFFLGSAPGVNISSQFSQNSVVLDAVILHSGFSQSTATLYLPTGLTAHRAEATVSNGNIEISASASSDRLYFETSNGNIGFTESTGNDIHLITDNGNINIKTAGLLNVTASAQNGNINLQTVGSVVTSAATYLSTNNGNIAINLNMLTSVKLTASTTIGVVRVSGLPFTSVVSTSTKYFGVLGAGDATLHATTQNGNIDIS